MGYHPCEVCNGVGLVRISTGKAVRWYDYVLLFGSLGWLWYLYRDCQRCGGSGRMQPPRRYWPYSDLGGAIGTGDLGI